MPLSWNEIKERALQFSTEWGTEFSEDAEAKSFLDAFFNVFGVSRRRVATFEKRIKKIDGRDGYIDLLWKSVLLIEQKSRGKDLDRAFQQAKDYFSGIPDRDLPRYILVSDFARFRLYDLELNTQNEFHISALHQNVHLFGFLAGYLTRSFGQQDPVNIKACDQMGQLHDSLRDIGYSGHALEVYLVRIVFCLFAENTGIFEKRAFSDWIEQRTSEDGSDLAAHLSTLFQVLDTPNEKRLRILDEQMATFPYINGEIFREQLPIAAFDSKMRARLLQAASLDWSRISPAIFGSLFQSVMDPEARRQLGAHYTSETNILKLIGPLFLDDLKTEFLSKKSNPKKLYEFQKRLSELTFLDPACGCGNFLVIAYRELRLLELGILRVLHGRSATHSLDVSTFQVQCDVDQFFGIEFEEFPAQIAQAALWMTDHQMNLQISEEFGSYFVRLPLKKSPTIIRGNALRIDWKSICPKADFILGNPPFVGKAFRSNLQNQDMEWVFKGAKHYRILDYVTCWYRKATEYMLGNQKTRSAFVSTNSITQGEQVGALWPDLLARGVNIQFAHRTFQWGSEARGKAAVHCVIIGFGLQEIDKKRIFEYEDIKAEPKEWIAKKINPYLIDASSILIQNRTTPLCSVSPMMFGNMPNDGGNLLLSPEEKSELLEKEPQAQKWIRPVLGAEEFLNGKERWCLWLVGIQPQELQAMPEVMKRVAAVRKFRLQSPREQTVQLAELPTLFAENRQPMEGSYILVPRTSSENRAYIPMGFLDSYVISTDSNQMIPNATLYEFGVLESKMHMAWMRVVCGRLESRYRYSAKLVYNNFPWPEKIGKEAIERAAQTVLEVRKNYSGATLANLYDPVSMPADLAKAHRKLDAAVDKAYSEQKFTGDQDRVAFLFERYRMLLEKTC
ncbi:DNA methyltransferase [Gammaproteobacteria bacterium]